MSSTASSLMLKHRLKLQAVKSELEFLSREKDIKRAKAEIVYRKQNLDTELRLVHKELPRLIKQRYGMELRTHFGIN